MLHDEASGDLVGDVALAARRLEDALATRLADFARAIVQDERHGRDREPHLSGDVLQRHLSHSATSRSRNTFTRIPQETRRGDRASTAMGTC